MIGLNERNLLFELLLIALNQFQFNFFHNEDQQEIISNQLKLYSDHAWGLGRLFQHTNLKRIFRDLQKWPGKPFWALLVFGLQENLTRQSLTMFHSNYNTDGQQQ